MIEGESLMNDGTAFVLFLVLLDIVEGAEANLVKILTKFFRLAIGGPLLGLIFGVILTTWLARINRKPILEANLTVCIAYITFYTAEHSAIHVSGILALVVLGLYSSHVGKARLTEASEEAIHAIWSYIGFCAESAIFLFAGMIMAHTMYDRAGIWADLGKSLGLYIMLHVIRFAALAVHLPIMRKLGYPMDIRHVALMAYAGLRGAVGLCLCLLVQKSEEVPKEVSNLILFHTSVIVLLTLFINGTTTGWMINKLGL